MPDGGVKARYEAGFPSDYNATPIADNGPDAEIYSAGRNLRNWARSLSKNSAIVKAVLDARSAKGIGTGLRYEPMVRNRKGELLTKLNDAIKRTHDEWSESADVTTELSRAEIERAVWRDWDTTGEVFGRKVYRGRSPNRLGYQVQLIRSELVPYGFMGQNGAQLGVDRDEWGAPQRYWVYPYSPDSSTWQFSVPYLQATPIPASEIKHLRRQNEMDATRGVTLFHSVIFRVSDIAEFQQSHRRAARGSANLFAAINRDIDSETDESTPEGLSSSGQRDLNLNEIQILDFLGRGESLQFSTPQHPNQNAVEFVNQELRQFAAACRVAFSWIAYVFDRAYAAQRVENVHAWEMIYEDRAHFIRDFAKPLLYIEPMRMALLEKRLPAAELRKADQSTLFDVRIQGPMMPSIDPLSDRKSAEVDQLQGWDSRQGIIRQFGRDPVQVDAEREQDEFLNKTQQQSLPLQDEDDNEQ